MSPLPIALIHGGSFSASCWDPTIPHLRDPAVAIDLPGRGRHPADLAGLTIADFVASALADIDESGFDRVVLVGHSMAGVTIPGLAARLGDRCAGIVFVACTVPPNGGTIIDTLPDEIQEMARAGASATAATGQPAVPDPERAFAMFGNGLTAATWQMTLRMQTPEAPGITLETVDTSPLDHVANKAWIVCTDDAIVPADKQRRFAATTGSEIVELDASHMAMIQRPVELAALIEDLRDRWS